MVEDICFHIVDLVQNAVAAGARNISIVIEERREGDELFLEVRDDGRGMDADGAAKAQDPFYSTKPFKKVGLGIPLLKATAQACRGDFAIESEPGRGTTIRARMDRSHIDCPPLGSLGETFLGLLISLPGLNLKFEFSSPRGRFALSTAEIREQIGDLHLSHPDVQAFLRDYFREGLLPLLA